MTNAPRKSKTPANEAQISGLQKLARTSPAIIMPAPANSRVVASNAGSTSRGRRAGPVLRTRFELIGTGRFAEAFVSESSFARISSISRSTRSGMSFLLRSNRRRSTDARRHPLYHRLNRRYVQLRFSACRLLPSSEISASLLVPARYEWSGTRGNSPGRRGPSSSRLVSCRERWHYWLAADHKSGHIRSEPSAPGSRRRLRAMLLSSVRR